MPSFTNGVVGTKAEGLAAVLTNVGVAAAPFLPGNTSGAGGVEVNLLSLAINGLVTPIKMFDWFDQHKWMPLLLLFAGVGLACIYWHDDIGKAILNGLASIPNAIVNYRALPMPAGTERTNGN